MMTDKFKNKFRIQSTRLQHWDYSWEAAYFVTVCTENRVHFFGKIIDGVMHLSNVGVIASVCWYEIKNHAKNIELGAFIVMPNHIHGIIIINQTTPAQSNQMERQEQSQKQKQSPSSKKFPVSITLNQQDLPDPCNKIIGHQRFQNQGKNSLSSIVGGYKSAVSKHTKRLGFDFAWQSRFYDHIIKDDQSFQRISDYIINNPLKWNEDKFYVS